MNPATLYTRALVVQQALELLECEARESDALASPDAVRDYLRLLLADRPHEVFAVVFLDAQNRVIETLELFRGTLTQTSVYPREVLIEALARNAASVILCHNHPSGVAEPSRADQVLTQTLKAALALVDVRLLDHIVIHASQSISVEPWPLGEIIDAIIDPTIDRQGVWQIGRDRQSCYGDDGLRQLLNERTQLPSQQPAIQTSISVTGKPRPHLRIDNLQIAVNRRFLFLLSHSRRPFAILAKHSGETGRTPLSHLLCNSTHRLHVESRRASADRVDPEHWVAIQQIACQMLTG